MKYFLPVLVLSFFINLPVSGQTRCAVDEHYFSKQLTQTQDFESWLAKKKQDQWILAPNSRTQASGLVYTLPVVVHVIHNGEALGTGGNLSDERIIEQLSILNADFRRKNSDTLLTPANFTGVAADTEIEFILARRDPEGLPTTGIVRKRGSKTSYAYNDSDDALLKSESYWPAEDYLNIYVADLRGFLGWASFPYTDLVGIENTEFNNNRLVDGVVLDYQFVGINPATGGSFESFGRTATHEIGHFLGLRHVWGDAFDCTADDYCDDTPMQSTNYDKTCPASEQTSCTSPDMYSNYLNYTDDACMNLFTQGQKSRMRTVLDFSPRRKSLRSSPALLDPLVTTHDLGIRSIISPAISECSTSILPAIEVRNYGSNSITSFTLSLYQDGVLVESLTKTVTLAPLATSIVNFSPLTIPSTVDTEFLYQVTDVNGLTDGNAANNVKSVRVYAINNSVLPYKLNFDSIPDVATRTESGIASAWSIQTAPYQTATNKAMTLNFAQNPATFGLFDYLVTPVFDLSFLNSAELSFSYAYAESSNAWNKDGLIVAVSTDCGATFPPSHYIFQKYGSALVTSPSKDSLFAPTKPADWFRETINFTPYVGNPNVRIAFIGHNGGSNILYLDSVELKSNSLKALDLGIRKVENFPVITCFSSIVPSLEIHNYGYTQIESFDLTYSFQSTQKTTSYTGLALASGQSKVINLPVINLENGTVTISINVSNPNNSADEFAANNVISRQLIVDNTEDALPLRIDFEKPDNWIIAQEQAAPIWELTSTGTNHTLKAAGFESLVLGTEHWFVSPRLKTSDMDKASLVFDYAYRSRAGTSDRLQVVLSANCGDQFQYLLFDKSSMELSGQQSETAFIPAADEVWNKVFIDLSEYMKWDDIRVAFIFTNGNGNNLYLDNIEFFNTNDPNLPHFDSPVTIYPNPATDYFNVSIHLKTRQNANVLLTDISGKIVFQKKMKNLLNQTFRIENPALSGVYLFSLIGEKTTYSQRVVIQSTR
ncbi:MAG: choice-of-anchor J domain-containing protein [Cyclobacteriaceae bacterium]|nr:choice-of-anchor J domain-containing protein [Cyclobacteriaceae bacterium]